MLGVMGTAWFPPAAAGAQRAHMQGLLGGHRGHQDCARALAQLGRQSAEPGLCGHSVPSAIRGAWDPYPHSTTSGCSVVTFHF